MKKFFVIIMSLLCDLTIMYSQNITGRVINEKGEAIESAAVILQTVDSLVVGACVTDSLGCFTFTTNPENYVLIIQQMSYKPKVLSGINKDIGDVILEEDTLMLQQATIRGYSSIMSVSENGALEFSTEKIMEGRPVVSAIDLLKEIPCLEKTGNSYNLVGSSRTAIIINGRKSKMDY